MAERPHRLTTVFSLCVVLAVLQAGCATTAPGRAPLPPPPPEAETPAGQSLLLQAREERAAGEYAQASMTLERAIRIEPREAAIWLELAGVRMDEGDFGQAEQLGRKARSLVSSDSRLAGPIDALIGEAARRQGR